MNHEPRRTLHLRNFEPVQIGNPWPSQGGAYAGEIGQRGAGQQLILADAGPGHLMAWAEGRAWVAALVAGRFNDYRMPDRLEAALLVERFPGLCLAPEYWLWTSETNFEADDTYGESRGRGSVAWRRYQGGHETGLAKSHVGTIVAVRRCIHRGEAR
jgi:hypothetical protein